MLDLGNAGERLFVSSPPVVFPALGGGRQIERGKINHTVDAKSVRRSVLSALRRISLSSTGKEAKMNHESGYGRAHRQAEHIFRNLLKFRQVRRSSGFDLLINNVHQSLSAVWIRQ